MTTGIAAIPLGNSQDETHPGAPLLGKKLLKRKLPLIGNKTLKKVINNMTRRLKNRKKES